MMTSFTKSKEYHTTSVSEASLLESYPDDETLQQKSGNASQLTDATSLNQEFPDDSTTENARSSSTSHVTVRAAIKEPEGNFSNSPSQTHQPHNMTSPHHHKMLQYPSISHLLSLQCHTKLHNIKQLMSQWHRYENDRFKMWANEVEMGRVEIVKLRCMMEICRERRSRGGSPNSPLLTETVHDGTVEHGNNNNNTEATVSQNSCECSAGGVAQHTAATEKRVPPPSSIDVSSAALTPLHKTLSQNSMHPYSPMYFKSDSAAAAASPSQRGSLFSKNRYQQQYGDMSSAAASSSSLHAMDSSSTKGSPKSNNKKHTHLMSSQLLSVLRGSSRAKFLEEQIQEVMRDKTSIKDAMVSTLSEIHIKREMYVKYLGQQMEKQCREHFNAHRRQTKDKQLKRMKQLLQEIDTQEKMLKAQLHRCQKQYLEEHVYAARKARQSPSSPNKRSNGSTSQNVSPDKQLQFTVSPRPLLQWKNSGISPTRARIESKIEACEKSIAKLRLVQQIFDQKYETLYNSLSSLRKHLIATPKDSSLREEKVKEVSVRSQQVNHMDQKRKTTLKQLESLQNQITRLKKRIPEVEERYERERLQQTRSQEELVPFEEHTELSSLQHTAQEMTQELGEMRKEIQSLVENLSLPDMDASKGSPVKDDQQQPEFSNTEVIDQLMRLLIQEQTLLEKDMRVLSKEYVQLHSEHTNLVRELVSIQWGDRLDEISDAESSETCMNQIETRLMEAKSQLNAVQSGYNEIVREMHATKAEYLQQDKECVTVFPYVTVKRLCDAQKEEEDSFMDSVEFHLLELNKRVLESIKGALHERIECSRIERRSLLEKEAHSPQRIKGSSHHHGEHIRSLRRSASYSMGVSSPSKPASLLKAAMMNKHSASSSEFVIRASSPQSNSRGMYHRIFSQENTERM